MMAKPFSPLRIQKCDVEIGFGIPKTVRTSTCLRPNRRIERDQSRNIFALAGNIFKKDSSIAARPLAGREIDHHRATDQQSLAPKIPSDGSFRCGQRISEIDIRYQGSDISDQKTGFPSYGSVVFFS
jgi:hypothetical protein